MGYPRELIGTNAGIEDADSTEWDEVYVDTDDLDHPVKIENWVPGNRVGKARRSIAEARHLAYLILQACDAAERKDLATFRRTTDPNVDRGLNRVGT